MHARVGSEAGKRWETVHRRPAHAGKIGASAQKFPEECESRRVVLILGLGQGYFKSQQAAAVESRIHPSESNEAANQQARTGEQNESQTHLRDDEGAPRVAALPCARATSSAFLQCL